LKRATDNGQRATAPTIALVLLLSCFATRPARAAFVDYLHIEANEGGSSGGHVALRLGDETFHFQHEDGGLIRMQRDDAGPFHVRYALLGNRPIHETRIAVSDDTQARLRTVFTRRLLVQAAQYDRLAALEGDVALFELWRRRAHGSISALRQAQGERKPTSVRAEPVEAPDLLSQRVRAAGYFLTDGFASGADGDSESPALIALRARVAERYGSAFLPDRIAAARAALADWRPQAVTGPVAALDLDVYPDFAPTASTAYADHLAALTAFEVLEAAPALRPDARRVAVELPPLDPDERRKLAALAGTLSDGLAALAVSTRPDAGAVLLLGMARLAAIEETLASGRWVVLDAFPADAPAAPLPGGASRVRYLDALAAELVPAMARAQADLFVSGRFREGDYTYFETTVNRLLEVLGARHDGRPLRTERGVLLPARAATRSELIAPPLPSAEAEAGLRQARAAVTDYRARLVELYGYNLISRNCVSEIFATIEAALGGAGDVETGTSGSAQRLGGVVRTEGTLNFIPFVSADAVAEHYATVAQRTRPSYRQLHLDELTAREPAWQIALRESNTLTSTAYQPGPRDSAFLFFTDDTVALRPLLGAANLLVGIADGLLGLVTWPADHGARLRAGWYGAVFSLPELVFVNIRKGSMAWIDPGEMPVEDASWRSGSSSL